MYAIIATGGKQYKVSEGDVIKVEKLDGAVGTTITFDQVLMLRKDEKTEFGTPILENCKITGEVLAQERDKKIEIVKFRRRKRYLRHQGHRQYITRVKITGTAN